MKYMVFLLSSFLILIQFRCANPIAPSGGPKDESPPQIIEEESTPNMQTGFEKKPIEFSFNEWIKIKDAFNQILVSPPLSYPYDIRAKGKKVVFKFAEEEILKENATYTVNFGSAIQDLTEGNAQENFRFVFSTGEKIDSLTFSGQVIDAVSGEAVENVFILMHDVLQDSSFRVHRPFYFAKTNKSGAFKIENVKADTFRVFALMDNNLNYLFDQVEESIAFVDNDIILNENSQSSIVFKLFKELSPLKLEKVDSSFSGVVRIKLNRSPFHNEWTLIGDTTSVLVESSEDSIIIWNRNLTDASLDLRLPNDTIELLIPTPDAPPALVLKTFSRQLKPGEKIFIRFNRPLANLDGSKARLMKDTLLIEDSLRFSFEPINPKKLVLLNRLDAKAAYLLELFPGAVEDIWGVQNDSTKTRTRIRSESNFGTIDFELTDLDSTVQYIVSLKKGKGSELLRDVITGTETFIKKYRGLEPGTYNFTVIEDINSNGYWDTGVFDLRVHPEFQFSKPVQNIRANWDVEVKMLFPSER